MNGYNGYQEVKLEDLACGGAAELFNSELTKAIENVMDINNDRKAVREVHLVLKMKPRSNDDRNVDFEVEVFSKLAKRYPIGKTMVVGIENGQPVAYEQNFEQIQMFDTDEPMPIQLHRVGGQQ